MVTLGFLSLPQGWEIMLIFLAILLIFGPKNLPKLGRMLGSSIREFRSATSKATSGEEEKPGAPERLAEAPVQRETAAEKRGEKVSS